MNVIVIGAGASGLVAAIQAKETGDEVTLLEKNDKVGKKILMTGNGHCNMAHINISADDYFDDTDDTNSFVKTVLDKFSYNHFIDFFNKVGIITRQEDGYIYPASMQASSVVNALRNYAERIGVKIKTNNEVKRITKTSKGYIINCGYEYSCDKLIVSSGGMSYTEVDGPANVALSLKELGLKVNKFKPALTALVCDSNINQASGVRVDCKIELFNGKKLITTEEGQLQITDYGVSGIPIFNISRFTNEESVLKIDFAPNYTAESLEYEFNKVLDRNEVGIYDLLCGFLNEKLVSLIVLELGLDKQSKVTDKTLRDAITLIKNYLVEVSSRRGFDFAQVSDGGVATRCIDSNTMESKDCKNLFVTGELIDIDAKCGGYNLFFAWATGYIAGSKK